MINPSSFTNFLIKQDLNYFCGVPDSFLKSLISEFEKQNHITMPNEGSAVAHAAGYYLANKKPAILYMQNSGLGNAINPLLSSAHKEVYGLGMIIFIGWRGEDGIGDEPQHLAQGQSLLPMLSSMNISHDLLSSNEDKAKAQIKSAVEKIKHNPAPHIFVVKKDTFKKTEPNIKENTHKIVRYEAIKTLLKTSPKSIFFATTGHTSRELYAAIDELKLDHKNCFYNTGAMGHGVQIALSFCLQNPQLNVIFLDGDGSLSMHLGNYLTLAHKKPKNFKTICFNNSAHLSVGAQKTSWEETSITKVISAMGIETSPALKQKSYTKKLNDFLNSDNLFLEVLCKNTPHSELPRPSSSHQHLKTNFMDSLCEN